MSGGRTPASPTAGEALNPLALRIESTLFTECSVLLCSSCWPVSSWELSFQEPTALLSNSTSVCRQTNGKEGGFEAVWCALHVVIGTVMLRELVRQVCNSLGGRRDVVDAVVTYLSNSQNTYRPLSWLRRAI